MFLAFGLLASRYEGFCSGLRASGHERLCFLFSASGHEGFVLGLRALIMYCVFGLRTAGREHLRFFFLDCMRQDMRVYVLRILDCA